MPLKHHEGSIASSTSDACHANFNRDRDIALPGASLRTRKGFAGGRFGSTASILCTAGAAKVLGPDHGVTKALAKASITMAKVDLWHAQLAVKTLRRDQREAIAEVGE